MRLIDEVNKAIEDKKEKEEADRIRQEKLHREREEKEIRLYADKIIPLIEKEVRKNITAGRWTINIPFNYHPKAAYIACESINFYCRMRAKDYIIISNEPEQYEYTLGNTD